MHFFQQTGCLRMECPRNGTGLLDLRVLDTSKLAKYKEDTNTSYKSQSI